MDYSYGTLSRIFVAALLSGLASRCAGKAIFEQQNSFYFDPAPVSQNVTENEEVRLRCDVSNRKLISFYWTLNNRLLPNTSRRFQEDGDLRFLWVDHVHDNGTFRCIATNVSNGIALRSREVHLNIFWISKTSEVQLQQPNTLEEIDENSEVLLRCSGDGNPKPTVQFFRNKARLFRTVRIKRQKNRLRIANVSASDAGVFSCRARNLVGKVDSLHNFILSIPGQDGPLIQVESFTSVLVVKKLSNTLLNCEFRGTTRTEWHFGTRNLTSLIDSKYKHWRNGSLTVTRVDSSDSGSYSCTGIAANGIRRTFVVEVLLAYLEEMKKNTFQPRPPKTKIVPATGRYTVLCRPPKGLPRPVLRWRDPNKLLLTGDMGRVSADEGILSLTDVEENDAGNYTCQAENLAGIQSRSIRIHVSEGMRFNPNPKDTKLELGKPARVPCLAIGLRRPSVHWRRHGHPSLPPHVRSIDGNLIFDVVKNDDAGEYSCFASSTGEGSIGIKISIDVIGQRSY